MKKLIINGTQLSLLDEDCYNKSKSGAEELSRLVKFLPELLRGYEFPTTKENLEGVFRDRWHYVVKATKEQVETWLQGSPLAESSKKRLVAEKVDSLSREFEEYVREWGEGIEDIYRTLAVTPNKEEYKFAEGKAEFNVKAYLARVEKACTQTITEENKKDETLLLDLIENVKALEAKGYNVIGRNIANLTADGMPYTTYCPGIINQALKEEGDLAPEYMFNLMHSCHVQF